MHVWNNKYNIEHEELEEKISVLADELALLDYEIETELANLKLLHWDWTVEELLNEIKKHYLENK